MNPNIVASNRSLFLAYPVYFPSKNSGKTRDERHQSSAKLLLPLLPVLLLPWPRAISTSL